MKTTPVTYQFEKKGFVWSWVGIDIIGTFVGLITAFRLNVGFVRYWTLPATWEAYLENLLLVKAFPAVAAVAGGVLVGNLLIGLGEQMIIRRHTHLATCWFLATATGVAIIAVYSVFSAGPEDYFLYNEILRPGLFPLLWLSIGLFQWLVLRKTVAHSGNWIWTTVLSPMAFLFIFSPLALTAVSVIWGIIDGVNYHYFYYYYAFYVLSIPVVVNALIKGLVIKDLLKQSAQKMAFNPVSQAPDKTTPPAAPEPQP